MRGRDWGRKRDRNAHIKYMNNITQFFKLEKGCGRENGRASCRERGKISVVAG